VENNVEQRLETGMMGKPKLKADEQRKYLGNFRERVELTMTNEEIFKDICFETFTNKLKEGFKEEVILFLHADLDTATLSKYTRLAKQFDINCMTKQTNMPITPETIVLVLAAKDLAVNVEQIDIEEMIPKQQGSPVTTQKKKGLLDKLFHKEK
jgi:uncharacterized protein YueI